MIMKGFFHYEDKKNRCHASCGCYGCRFSCKTDKMDSEWICKLHLAGLLKPSYIPPKELRKLRDLTRYRNKLIQSIAAEKNRMMRVLEDCNIKHSSVVSNTSGVSVTVLIDMLCEGHKLTMTDIKSVYHKKLSASPQELL